MLVRYRNQGQAMVEFVVMTAGCLLLLFVLVPVVAKLADMAYKAQEIARYTAWERTVWYSPVDDGSKPSLSGKSDGYIAERSNEKILTSAEDRIINFGSDILPLGPAGETQSSGNHFWKWTHRAGEKDMVKSYAMLEGSRIQSAKTPSKGYEVIEVYNDVMRVIAKVISIFTLNFSGSNDDYLQVAHPMRNFYTSNIEIPVPLTNGALGSNPLFGEKFQLQQLTVGARSAVLADGWIPQDEQHFREKADDFVLGSMIENNPIWATARRLVSIFEPSVKDVNFAPVNTAPMPDENPVCEGLKSTDKIPRPGFCYYKKKEK